MMFLLWFFSVLCGAVVFLWSQSASRDKAVRDPVLPFLPSHIEAIGGEPDVTTRFLAAVHDMNMEVIEAWNAGSARRRIAGGVQGAMNSKRLAATCKTVVKEGKRLRKQLAGYEALGDRARETLALVTAVWRHERTVLAVRGTKGEPGHEDPGAVEGADHQFFFDARRCDEAEAAVAGLLEEAAGLELYQPPNDIRVDVTRLEEVERMFLRRLVQDTVLRSPGIPVDDATLESLANEWLVGARLPGQLAQIWDHLEALRGGYTDAFGLMRQSEALTEVRSAAGASEGPEGLRASGQLRRALGGMDLAVGSMMRTVERVQVVARLLTRLARDDQPVPDEEFLRLADEAQDLVFPDSALDLGRTLSVQAWRRSLGLGFAAAALVQVVVRWL
jgi:hypothetical protein